MKNYEFYLSPMKKAVHVLFTIVCLFSTLAIGQAETADIQKLRRAEQTADRFTQRFRETLDFGIVWKEFRASKVSSSVYLQDAVTARREGQEGISDALIEQGYVALMNYVYLKFVHDLSVSKMDSNASEEEITPAEIKAAESLNKYITTNGEEPKNAKELKAYIAEANKLARLYRKNVSRSAFDTATYKENLRYLARFYGQGEDKHSIVETDKEMGFGKGVNRVQSDERCFSLRLH